MNIRLKLEGLFVDAKLPSLHTVEDPTLGDLSLINYIKGIGSIELIKLILVQDRLISPTAHLGPFYVP